MRESTRRQVQAMSFVMLLSPATRLLPGAAARAAGAGGWLCPILALPLCLGAAALVSRALAGRAEGEGLGEVLVSGLPRLGRGVAALYALWLALYAGFAVRSAASRFIYTIYTGSSPGIFVAVGLALGLLGALGSEKRLARSAEIFRVLLIAALLPIAVVGLAQADLRALAPFPMPEPLPLAEGVLTALGTVGFVLVNVPLLETGTPIGRRGRAMSLWSARICVFLALLCAAVIGRFGPELSAALAYPFFALVRNTGLFGVAERIEALVTALWVLSDFVLAAFSLTAAARLARLALNIKPRPGPLSPRALTSAACAALALACALAIAPDSRVLRFVSERVVVWTNLAMCALMSAAALAAARSRRAAGGRGENAAE